MIFSRLNFLGRPGPGPGHFSRGFGKIKRGPLVRASITPKGVPKTPRLGNAEGGRGLLHERAGDSDTVRRKLPPFSGRPPITGTARNGRQRGKLAKGLKDRLQAGGWLCVFCGPSSPGPDTPPITKGRPLRGTRWPSQKMSIQKEKNP